MFFHMLGAFAEFERAMIRERCVAGFEAAKASGQQFGRERSLAEKTGAKLVRIYQSGNYTKQALADYFEVHTSSVKRATYRVAKLPAVSHRQSKDLLLMICCLFWVIFTGVAKAMNSVICLTYARSVALAVGIVLFVMPFTVLSQQSSPSPTGLATSTQMQAPQQSQSVSASSRNELGTAQNPLVIQSVPNASSEADTAHKQYEQREKPSLDRGIAFSTYVLAASTVFLTFFTGLMWHATYKLAVLGRANAKQQADDTRAALAIAQSSADAAKEAAETAKQQMKIASDELHRSHRPWLTLTDQSFPCKVEFDGQQAKLKLSCAFINGGSSIAKACKTFLNLQAAADGIDPRHYLRIDELPDLSEFGALVLPGATHKISSDMTAHTSHIEQSSGIRLFLSIRLIYQDEFDRTHESRHFLEFRSDKDDPSISRSAKIVRGTFNTAGFGTYAD